MSQHINLLELGFKPKISLDASNPSHTTTHMSLHLLASSILLFSFKCPSLSQLNPLFTCNGPGLLPTPQIACHTCLPGFLLPSKHKQAILAGLRCEQPGKASQLIIITPLNHPKVSLTSVRHLFFRETGSLLCQPGLSSTGKPNSSHFLKAGHCPMGSLFLVTPLLLQTRSTEKFSSFVSSSD